MSHSDAEPQRDQNMSTIREKGRKRRRLDPEMCLSTQETERRYAVFECCICKQGMQPRGLNVDAALDACVKTRKALKYQILWSLVEHSRALPRLGDTLERAGRAWHIAGKGKGDSMREPRSHNNERLSPCSNATTVCFTSFVRLSQALA